MSRSKSCPPLQSTYSLLLWTMHFFHAIKQTPLLSMSPQYSFVALESVYHENGGSGAFLPAFRPTGLCFFPMPVLQRAQCHLENWSAPHIGIVFPLWPLVHADRYCVFPHPLDSRKLADAFVPWRKWDRNVLIRRFCCQKSRKCSEKRARARRLESHGLSATATVALYT